MKGFGALVAGVALIAAMYFYISKSMAMEVVTLPVGYGKPTADSVEMHVAVSMFLPKKDPPKLEHNIVQWDKWVAEHFQLQDSTGAAVQLQRTGFSNILSDRQSGGTPEFWLKATLKPGATYTFVFTPIVPAPTYRHTFKAPTEPTDADWFSFDSGE